MSLATCIDDINNASSRCTDYDIDQASSNLLTLPNSCKNYSNVCENYLGPTTNGSEWKSVGNNQCQRVAYKGDPGYCCISDSNRYLNPNPCFDTSGYTCSPHNRSNVQTLCYANIVDYCSEASSISLMESNWSGLYPPCMYTLDSWFLGSTTPLSVVGGTPIPPNFYNNIYGLSASSDMLIQFNRLYNNWGYELGAQPGTKEYNNIEENIYSICSASPGSCTDMLTEYCSNVSTQDITANPNLLRWCGCYMPDQEYSKYVNQYQLNKECTPLCNRSGNIPLTTPDKTTSKTCSTDNCLIDDVSINLMNTNIGGNISFTQLCGGCGVDQEGVTRSCTCILDNLTLTLANTNLQGSINLDQQCGSSVCYNYNSNTNGPNKVSVPCDTDLPESTTSANLITSNYDNLYPYIWIGIIILALLFLLIIWRGPEPKASPTLPSAHITRASNYW